MVRLVANPSEVGLIAGLLGVLALCLLAGSSPERGLWAFGLSIPLALIAIGTGLHSLFVLRRYASALAGIVLGGGVILFWMFLALCAILIVQTSLP